MLKAKGLSNQQKKGSQLLGKYFLIIVSLYEIRVVGDPDVDLHRGDVHRLLGAPPHLQRAPVLWLHQLLPPWAGETSQDDLLTHGVL